MRLAMAGFRAFRATTSDTVGDIDLKKTQRRIPGSRQYEQFLPLHISELLRLRTSRRVNAKYSTMYARTPIGFVMRRQPKAERQPLNVARVPVAITLAVKETEWR